MTERVRPIVLGEGAAPPDSLVGAKAAELARMMELGLSVPPAFALPTSLCAGVIAEDAGAVSALRDAAAEGIARLEAATGNRFGDSRAPLLVSVRSGAEKSMPGMLDTVLNVGLRDASVHGLIRQSGDVRLAYDSHRRFLFAYAETVGGAPAAEFEAALQRLIEAEGVADEAELDSDAMERLAGEYRALAAHQNAAPPDDPLDQLVACARAVYRSWESPRSREYRRLNGLTGLAGTAVTVQAMVFGNAGADSGAGVAFSRDPATGAKALYVDFVFDAQGEDVVSGRRTPGDAAELWRRLPAVAGELEIGAQRLEQIHADVQDIEFTVERGKLWFLQARAAKRTPRAALRIAVDFVAEGVLKRAEALERLAGVDLAAARVGRFATEAEAAAKATIASPGVACGRVCFSAKRAREIADRGEPVILARHDASTDDVEGFAAACGVLTAVGGRTSHAAVVARQMGKVCLVGCAAFSLAPDGLSGKIGAREVREGDWIALDGSRGEISLGRREILFEEPSELAVVRKWRA